MKVKLYDEGIWQRSGVRLFAWLICLFCVAGLATLLFFKKGEVVLLVNGMHTSLADVFFKYFTHLGDGAVVVAGIAVLLLVSYRAGILMAAVAIMQLAVSQGSKRLLFANMPRPAAFFGPAQLHFVNGVSIHSKYSFPSGHTLTAFSIAALVVLMFPERRRLALAMFCYAALVGLSRIYLAQHFFMDIYAGALVGTTFTTAIYVCLNRLRWMQLPKLQNGLLKAV